jgi:uncharacterized iron-regulated protein
MKRNLLLALILVIVTAALGIALGRADDVFRVRDGITMTFGEMIDEAKKSDVILVGELHNLPENHRLELRTIQALHDAGVRIAVGLEMFRADSQKSLDGWVKGTLPLDKFLPVYYDNWREGWPLYRDIFSYAREHRIPLVGLNIPDVIAQAVAQKGFTQLSPQEKKELPPGISCDVDRTYMDFIKKAYAGHSHRVDGRFLNFCEAQMVWDKSMAWHLVQYLQNHKGEKVVVLAGVGHAWKQGIPEQLGRLSSYSSTVILPVVPGQVEPDSVTVEDADFVVLP